MAVRISKAVPDPQNAFNVGSVRTFLDALEKIDQDVGDILFFRGHESHAFELLPSVYRNIGLIENEDVIFKELVLRCPNEFAGIDSTFQMLVKMQHYSLPTRLLDITLNPLVALYFASITTTQKESGEVVVFRFPKTSVKYFDSDTVSVISNISRRPSSFSFDMSADVDAFNASQQARLLLHEIKKEKPYFEGHIKPADLASVVCVKPKLDNARIVRQDGAFLLFGAKGVKSTPAQVSQEYLARPEGRRIIITNKSLIRKQLGSLGLTQGTIFPEIDRVAEYIRRVYEIDGK